MNFLWSSFRATPQVSSVLPNLLPSFRFSLYRSLSRRLVYFITFMPFCQPLFSLSAFFTLYFPFLISFCPFCFAPLFFSYKKWQLSVAQLSLGIVYYIKKKINSQNRSSVSHWRRHPDLNWGSRCCRPMPYHLAIAPYWSGLRGSNSLPPPWQGGALPDELNPHLMVSTILYARYRNLIHKECIGDRNGARTHDL